MLRVLSTEQVQVRHCYGVSYGGTDAPPIPPRLVSHLLVHNPDLKNDEALKRLHQEFQADIRQVLRARGAASLAASQLDQDRRAKANPLVKPATLPAPVVLEFWGPDRKWKGRDAIARGKRVQEVADGLAEPHTLPLCSYEQSAWHAVGLFRRGQPVADQENTGTQSNEQPGVVFIISHDYPQLPVAELAAGIAALQRPVNLLLQRTTILSLEARGEEANNQAFERLLENVCCLHLRCVRNLSAVSAGVRKRHLFANVGSYGMRAHLCTCKLHTDMLTPSPPAKRCRPSASPSACSTTKN